MSDDTQDLTTPAAFADATKGEALASFGTQELSNAAWVGFLFYHALLDPVDKAALEALVVDPTHWGDWGEAAKGMRDTALPSGVEYESRKGRRVAYMRALPESAMGDPGYKVAVKGGVVQGAARWIMLVQHDQRWYVWGFGERVPAEHIVI